MLTNPWDSTAPGVRPYNAYREALFNFYFLIFNYASRSPPVFHIHKANHNLPFSTLHSQLSIYFLFTIITLISITARPESCISVTFSWPRPAPITMATTGFT